jgi:predicted choloylglycine hydrolase
MDQSALEEKKADYQAFEAKGSHYEIGLITASHAGSLQAANAALNLDQPGLAERSRTIAPALNREQLHYAERCRTIVQQLYPEIVDEFAGYAAGLQLKEEELLWHYTLGVAGGCSAMAVRTPQGMVVGRNYDYFYWENRRHLICTRPENGYSHIGMHEGLVGGRFDGMNEQGLFVSFNGAGPHPDPALPGLSFHLIVRYLLEKCSTALEAKDALLELPIKEPKSYLVVDPQDAFVVEAHPSRREVRSMDGDELIVTNHYKHPNMAPLQKEFPNSGARYRKLERIAGQMATSVVKSSPVEEIKAAMADHEAPICGHNDGMATFWSCVAEPQKRDIRYSLGAPCRNGYNLYFAF